MLHFLDLVISPSMRHFFSCFRIPRQKILSLGFASRDSFWKSKCMPHGKLLKLYKEFGSILLVLRFILIAIVKDVATCQLEAFQQLLDFHSILRLQSHQLFDIFSLVLSNFQTYHLLWLLDTHHFSVSCSTPTIWVLCGLCALLQNGRIRG